MDVKEVTENTFPIVPGPSGRTPSGAVTFCWQGTVAELNFYPGSSIEMQVKLQSVLSS